MMQNMKRIISFCLCILFCAVAFAGGEKTSVSKIKVFLDDVELTGDAETDFESGIKLSTILSFTKFSVGKEISEDSLEKEIVQTQLRLLNSGLFYTVSVSKMKSRKNPGTYVIYISVSTGFLKRFGGGGIYGIFGNAGIGGYRQQLLYFAGWNKNGVSYLYEHIGNTPLIAGGDLFTNIPSCFVDKNGVEVFGKATFGSFITPDFRFCVDVNAGFNFETMSFTPELSISPYLASVNFVSERFFWTSELRFNYFPLLNWDEYFEGAFTFNFAPIKQLTLSSLVCGGYASSGYKDKIQLLRESSLCYGLGLSNREIRSGYSIDELSVNGYLMGTVEVKWNAFDYTVPPCFPCHLVPYVFADIACVEKKDAVGFRDSYGAGVYLNFDCPVFATFNFSYGINHEGKGRFCFAAMQSF